MATYDVDLLHQRILRILLAVDNCCRQHRLRYYIWAGTQLGAVLHKGFGKAGADSASYNFRRLYFL